MGQGFQGRKRATVLPSDEGLGRGVSPLGGGAIGGKRESRVLDGPMGMLPQLGGAHKRESRAFSIMDSDSPMLPHMMMERNKRESRAFSIMDSDSPMAGGLLRNVAQND